MRPLGLVERERERLPGAPGGGHQPIAAQQRVRGTVGQPAFEDIAAQSRVRDDLVAMGDQVLPGEDGQLLERRALEARLGAPVPGRARHRMGPQPPKRIRLVPFEAFPAPAVSPAETLAHPEEARRPGDRVHGSAAGSAAVRRKRTTDW